MDRGPVMGEQGPKLERHIFQTLSQCLYVPFPDIILAFLTEYKARRGFVFFNEYKARRGFPLFNEDLMS